MKFVRKRDGRLEPFDQERITAAVWKAAKAVGGKDREQAKIISDQVVAELEQRFGVDGCPTVEEIQDLSKKCSSRMVALKPPKRISSTASSIRTCAS
jgi:anaerobic ribonucleoside-triphosphate reductase